MFRGRGSAAVRMRTSEMGSAVSSDSCQSAAVCRTTDDVIQTPDVPTSTLKVRCWVRSDWSVNPVSVDMTSCYQLAHEVCACVCSRADAKLGVFHYRSGEGQYKLNFSAAQQACAALGGSLATYAQLSYAQQVSEHNTEPASLVSGTSL